MKENTLRTCEDCRRSYWGKNVMSEKGKLWCEFDLKWAEDIVMVLKELVSRMIPSS